MAKEPKVKIGDRFGKLVTLEKVDMPVMTRIKNKDGSVKEIPNGKTKVGWVCKCDCGRTTTLPENTLVKERSTLRSCDKCPPIENSNYVSPKESYEEKKKLDELYNYVRINIFNYDENQVLPSFVITRLKGLCHGKYMANNKSKNNANYSYETVLNTFKVCALDIYRILNTKTFKDDQHKFNYITKIIENNINDVYKKEKQTERIKEEIKNDNDSRVLDYVNNFKAEEEPLNNSNLYEDLW